MCNWSRWLDWVEHALELIPNLTDEAVFLIAWSILTGKLSHYSQIFDKALKTFKVYTEKVKLKKKETAAQENARQALMDDATARAAASTGTDLMAMEAENVRDDKQTKKMENAGGHLLVRCLELVTDFALKTSIKIIAYAAEPSLLQLKQCMKDFRIPALAQAAFVDRAVDENKWFAVIKEGVEKLYCLKTLKKVGFTTTFTTTITAEDCAREDAVARTMMRYVMALAKYKALDGLWFSRQWPGMFFGFGTKDECAREILQGALIEDIEDRESAMREDHIPNVDLMCKRHPFRIKSNQ